MIVSKSTTLATLVVVSVLSIGDAWIGSPRPRCHTCSPSSSSQHRHLHPRSSASRLQVQSSNVPENLLKSSPTSSRKASEKISFFASVVKATSTIDDLQQDLRVASLTTPTASKDSSRDEEAKPLSNVNNEQDGINPAAMIAALVAVTAGVFLSSHSGQGSAFLDSAQEILNDPSAAFQKVVLAVEGMGSMGPVYFGMAYTMAEILAIPAMPLTASAGYLFGPVLGTGVVLLSASVAAAVSFGIGRTLLRNYVEGVLVDYPDFKKMDRAIGKEGFKLMLLLRLSPIFPFALSNYLYGATSIDFASFFWATLLGFAPGTFAFVYTGYAGKALTDGSGAYPWFVYVGGLTVFAGLMKLLADTATRMVAELEDEED